MGIVIMPHRRQIAGIKLGDRVERNAHELVADIRIFKAFKDVVSKGP